MMTRELVELKHKVLLERIDRLYNIFIVLSQDEKHISKLNAIKVIKEQYEKMYQAIIQSGEYDKYEEVENTIMPKLAQIEHHLDVHIYKTFGNCQEFFDRYIKELEKYDNYNNLDGELDKIKALKEILKLYSSYISQELKEMLAQKISAIKFEILLRKQIQLMPDRNAESLLMQYESEEEKETFQILIRERFKTYIECLSEENNFSRKKEQVEIIKLMQDGESINELLKSEIRIFLDDYGKRISLIRSICETIYKVEQVTRKINYSRELNKSESRFEMYSILRWQTWTNRQYDKYLKIRAEITPILEELEKKVQEIGGIDYILDTVISKEYHLNALLQEEEETPRHLLSSLMEKCYPDKLPEEDGRYKKAENMYQLRKEVRRELEWNYGEDWGMSSIIEDNPELKELFEFPIFDKSVLDYDEELNSFHFRGRHVNLEYLSDLINGKFSLYDWLAFGNIHEDDYNPRKKVDEYSMNYSQTLVWNLYEELKYSDRIKPQYVYYLIQLDDEVVTDTEFSESLNNYWPINGEEFYKVVNFRNVPYGGTRNANDLERLYVRTKQLLIKKREIKLPLDETKMKKLSNDEAEALKQTVKKGSLEYNVDNIIKNIFDLWPETEENKQRREAVRKSIKKELIKMGTENYLKLRIQKIECQELYEAIKNEIQRTMTSFSGYKNFQSEAEKVVHLISFIHEFLETGEEFREFGGQVEFDLLLRRQIERILYKNGGKGNRSEFDLQRNLGIDFFRKNSFHFGEKLSEYLGIERRIDYKIMDDNDKVNAILLNDMNARPEKYLLVLDAPEENSIVPKETRNKIAECAKMLEVKEQEEEER
mgnify:CR=1 FL=1